jgi:hypothetical protein
MTELGTREGIGKKILFFIFAVFFLFLSLQVHWSDSELWSIGLSRHLFSMDNPSLDYKSFFNFSLRWLYLIAPDNLQVIEGARLFYAVLGLILLLQIYTILRRAGRTSETSFWGLFLMAGSTLFLSQGFKVRSDILACVFQMAGVIYFLFLFNQKKNNPRISWNPLFLSICLNFLVLLATPKAVYHLAVNFVFIFLVLSLHKVPWRKKYLLFNFALPLALFGLLAAFKHEEFATALRFFFKSYQASPYHPAFWDPQSFEFVGDAALRNLPLILLILAGLFFRKARGEDKMTLAFAGGAVASLFFILIHNDRLPFFIFSLSAFPVLFATLIWTRLQNRAWRILMILFVVINGAFYIHSMKKAAGSSEQREAILVMQKYLRDHGSPLYYDATSVLSKDNRIFIFPAPQHPGNQQEVLDTFNRPDLSLIFFGNRLFYYMTSLYASLEDHYFIQISPGVFARSHAIRATHQVTTEEWKDFCLQFKMPATVYAYVGSGFADMKLSDVKLSCQSGYTAVSTTEPFIALTPYEPIPFPKDRSFAQIFDHRPFY